MTACTNHGGKARRVVTAALVGVLSVGTVPMVALATEASDGIQTLAANWSTDAKVTAAEDGKGASYTGDLTKPVSFGLGSGKYLVPTEVTNQGGDVTPVNNDDYDFTYTVVSPTWTPVNDGGAVVGYKGLKSGQQYWYVGADEKPVYVDFVNTLDEGAAAAYFSGSLFTSGARGTLMANKPVSVAEGDFRVTVTEHGAAAGTTEKVEMAFSIKADNEYAGAYAYENGDPEDKSLVYDGKNKIISIAKADKTQIKYASGAEIIYYESDGTEARRGDNLTVTGTGSYSAVVKVNGENKVTVSFTVEKFDVSKHGKSVSDTTTAPSATDVVKAVVGTDLAGAFKVTDVTAPSGAKTFDGSHGEYTVTVSAIADGQAGYDANVTGEKTVKFSYLNDSVFTNEHLTNPADLVLGLYYGSETPGTVNVNLTEGESFDASKISVRDKDGSPSYSGDALEVSYYNDDTHEVVDASALAEAGDYTVTVRVKPFQDSNGRWVGGTDDFKVKVSGDEAYGDNVSFYLDGEVAGDSEQAEYDGTDQLERVSAKVVNPAGGLFEYGTDFVLEAKNAKGDVVESVVDAGEYTVTIKPLTFTLDKTDADNGEYTLTLEVTARKLDNLKSYGYDGEGREKAADGTTPLFPTNKNQLGANRNYPAADYTNDAVAWTGSAVEVPGVQYWDADAEAWVELDKSLYNVVTIKKGKSTVKEAVDPGTYTATIALSDEAGSNYALKARTFDFEVVKYAPFDDVESPAWYASAVADAKFTNIVNGISGTNMFAPGAQITRAEAVCIMFNLAGGDSAMGDYEYDEQSGWVTGFSDVDGHAYYAQALAWAHNAGVVNGNGGKFDPDGKLTREQLAAMLANYAIATGDYEASDGSALAALPDANTVSDWAQGAVAWAVDKGIMGNGGSVMAQNTITRSEVAAMAVNYAKTF